MRSLAQLLLYTFLFVLCAAQQEATYDWQNWDYYAILGLQDNLQADDKTIKKAYRREAKQWHPDKVLTQKNNKIDKQEANQRFARIAEAYQVLTDPEKRKSYNQYLAQRMHQKHQQHHHRQQKQQQKQQQQKRNEESATSFTSDDFNSLLESFWGNWQETLDPRRVFEEMFGSGSEDDEDEDSAKTFPMFDIFDFLRSVLEPESPPRHEPPRQRQRQQKPSLRDLHHVQEEEKVLVDGSGREIYRVQRTEEYLQPQNQVYVRVLVQDYVEEWNPRTRSWVLVALYSEPRILQEGYRPLERNSRQRESQNRQQEQRGQQQRRQQQKQQTQQKQQSFSSEKYILLPGETLTPKQPLIRNNFKAGLTAECELVVVQLLDSDNNKSGKRQESFILWESDGTPSRYSDPDACSLHLNGRTGQLSIQLKVSSKHRYQQYQGRQNSVELWTSDLHDDHDEMNDFWNMNGDHKIHYLARLDTDGAFSVYRAQELPTWLLSALGLGDLEHVEYDSRAVGRALRKLHQIWQILVRKGLNLQELETNTFGNKRLARFVCTFTTAPVGRLRLSRFLWHQIRSIKIASPALLRFVKRNLNNRSLVRFVKHKLSKLLLLVDRLTSQK